MGHSIRTFRAASLGLALALAAAGGAQARPPAAANRSLDSVHQPIVSRTDYVLDVTSGPSGLMPGEADRLTGWFDGLGLGYGDTITVDRSALWQGSPAQDAVSAIAARYGMLVAHDAPPITAGHPQSGALRVVVSRATASVEGCPDWSRGNYSEYAGASQSNFGCSAAVNMAAMIANPQDLVEGRSGDRSSDAMVTLKAIKSYRDAAATGAGGLKSESSQSGGSGGGGK